MRQHDERRARTALARLRAPDEEDAAARAWRVVRAAAAEPLEAPPAAPRRRRALELVAVLAALAALVSPAGAAVRHWVADTVDPGVQHARPALTSLPAPGSLLVQSAHGPWVVKPDGSRRLLGDFAESSWSPHGLFVAATSPHALSAVEPGGEVRWSISRPGPVRLPRWNGPDGFRIAYLDGSSLRVVDGDGSGDHEVATGLAAVAPAWRPGPGHELSFVRSSGAVATIGADTGAKALLTAPGPRPLSLQWSAAGDRLLVARPRALQLLAADGSRRWTWRPGPKAGRLAAASLAPDGGSVAAILSAPGGSRLLLLRPGTPPRRLFAGPGRFAAVEWSPGGRWLLLAWKSADQWLFLQPNRPRRIVAVANVARQFDPGAPPGAAAFPRVEGWCCRR